MMSIELDLEVFEGKGNLSVDPFWRIRVKPVERKTEIYIIIV